MGGWVGGTYRSTPQALSTARKVLTLGEREAWALMRSMMVWTAAWEEVEEEIEEEEGFFLRSWARDWATQAVERKGVGFHLQALHEVLDLGRWVGG